MAVYAFNYVDEFRDSDGEMKYVYGRFIGEQLWKVWLPKSDDKQASRILDKKAKELQP